MYSNRKVGKDLNRYFANDEIQLTMYIVLSFDYGLAV